MSTLASAPLRDTGVRTRRRGAPRPVLTAVPAPAPSHGGMLLVCAGLLLSGLLTLLFLNMSLAEGSFTVHELQRTAGELAETEDALEQSITAVSSPAALASRASRMGMVPAASPAFLRLDDGAVLGVAEPASDDTAFSVVVKPPRTAPPALAVARSATTDRR
ncbi:cell division protein FtsL [Nostocoides sp. F2B08]|uniref:cell division protein FtsL n=1 Tax=Nostocoides sp. F2B08 TaxID=2653936 RepID=UPI0012630FB6|nr:cell division protein FtsL [Tetrasphaera sp. F2B08]KAB7741049.1 cell division protein FtsL [Tetrasphaera sp. F2B08]